MALIGLEVTGRSFVTILPTNMRQQFRKLAKFDRHDIVANSINIIV
ncbi:MAG: hypothetical protein JO327_07405 [Nitrososphaeraceae archaeon]|nr:hypothetical protein [Nitrososphaeraceae archaeon]MBV9667942.1 hypothetical protein [Nitrososphaeraceae archaeon]